MTGKVLEFPPIRLTRVQQALVEEAWPSVRNVASQLWWRRSGAIGWEDLLAIGSVKLAEVVRNFDPARGVSLWTYAQPAVRGAMLDAMGLETRRQKVVRLGTDKAIDVQVEEGSPGSFADALVAGMLASLSGAPIRAEDVESELCLEETLSQVRSAVAGLSTEDNRIIDLHYVEGLPLEKVGQTMGMGRTVVKARHRGALLRLSARLRWVGIRDRSALIAT